jgi:hypothetical protein
MKAPMDKVLKRLKERGFCPGTGEPTAKGLWTSLDADQIIQLYSSVNRGLQNYYRFVDNWKQCSRIQYILKFSLAKTLAQKYKISVPQLFQRLGKDLSLLIKGQGGKADRQVCFYLNRDWPFREETRRTWTWCEPLFASELAPNWENPAVYVAKHRNRSRCSISDIFGN